MMTEHAPDLTRSTTVYVDEPIYPYGRMMMCHMISTDIDALNAMADKIGVPRKWIQSKPVPHYDICKSKRSAALRHGAVEADRHKIVEVMDILRTRQRHD